jgi:hypothetical protein
MYYGIDATVRYSLNLINSKVMILFNLGGGYTFLGIELTELLIQVQDNIWFTEKVGLSLESLIKKSFGDREDAAGVIEFHLIFNIQQVLLSNLEVKIRTVMESTIKMMLVQKLLV